MNDTCRRRNCKIASTKSMYDERPYFFPFFTRLANSSINFPGEKSTLPVLNYDASLLEEDSLLKSELVPFLVRKGRGDHAGGLNGGKKRKR